MERPGTEIVQKHAYFYDEVKISKKRRQRFEVGPKRSSIIAK